ncbi:MAG: type II toxin-antitoxin system RelE/ParE family toxin [Nitrospira sp.]|nr:type II toxin-antitoxin system RelE/ParE family toxin [Nitrospira sp.]
MGKFQIFETSAFKEDLAKLDRAGLRRIQEKLETYIYPRLRADPHHGLNIKRLKNWEPPTWRYRVGAWRFFYEINEREKRVYMITADHRREAYR